MIKKSIPYIVQRISGNIHFLVDQTVDTERVLIAAIIRESNSIKNKSYDLRSNCWGKEIRMMNVNHVTTQKRIKDILR